MATTTASTSSGGGALALDAPAVVAGARSGDRRVRQEPGAAPRRQRQQAVAHVARAVRRGKELGRLLLLDQRQAELALEEGDLLGERPRAEDLAQRVGRRVGDEARSSTRAGRMLQRPPPLIRIFRPPSAVRSSSSVSAPCGRGEDRGHRSRGAGADDGDAASGHRSRTPGGAVSPGRLMGRPPLPRPRPRSRAPARPTSPSLRDSSRAVCGRSAGSLARHASTSRSSAGGIGRSVRADGGTGAVLHVVHQDRHRRVAGEHVLAGQQPVGDAPGGVDVGPAVHAGVAHRLLGRDEGGRALDDVLRGEPRAPAASPARRAPSPARSRAPSRSRGPRRSGRGRCWRA